MGLLGNGVGNVVGKFVAGSLRVNAVVILIAPYPDAKPATTVTAPEPDGGRTSVALPVTSMPTRVAVPPVIIEAATLLLCPPAVHETPPVNDAPNNKNHIIRKKYKQ